MSKASFIYETVLEKYKKRHNRILLYALIFNTIINIVSAISSAILAINDEDFIWIAFGFNVFIFMGTGIATVLTGTLKIFKWDQKVTEMTKFIEKLDSFYSEISSELLLPPQLRTNALEFIKREDANYLNIMRQSPNIYRSEFIKANKKFKNFIKDNSLNFKIAQKFGWAQDAHAEIV